MEALLDWTRGRGVAAAFECVGSEKAAQQALSAIKKRGKLVIVGVSPPAHAESLGPDLPGADPDRDAQLQYPGIRRNGWAGPHRFAANPGRHPPLPAGRG
jgi:threonine dehydrogenase-like Zn-dependent dehydrogenase